MQKLDKLDRIILRMISKDARVPFLEVARACDVSGAAIHQRMQKLMSCGIIQGSHFDLDPECLGFHTCAYVGVNLKDPSQFDEVVKKMESIPEIVECHYTTGDFDMFIKVFAASNNDLLTLIHDKLQPLGLASTKTLISFKTAFARELPVLEPEERRHKK